MQHSNANTSTPTTTSIKHTIISYKQSELYSSRAEYTTEADTDDDATQKIQQLRQSGYTISSWTQNTVKTARKGQ